MRDDTACGAPGGNRTPDAGLRTASLYPLSYGGGAAPILHAAPYDRPMTPPAHPVLYERANCHLCDEARELLDDLIGPDAYERIDIDTSDELIVRYGFRVPVLAVDGVDRLEAPIGGPDLRALLGEVRG
jgi:glutaredoxin